jgi:flavorubredoxin
MKDFIHDMQALNLQKRTVSILENGTWAPQSKDLMVSMLEEMQEMNVMEEKMTIMSSASDDDREAICRMAEEIKASLEE